MNRHFRNFSIAIASGAVLAVAGAVFANVPNNYYDITDKKESQTEADIDMAGSMNFVSVETECADFPGGNSTEGSYVQFFSTHPDSVKLKKNKGSLEQSQKGNQALLYIETGNGTANRENYLLCDKIEVSGDVNTKKSPITGSFEGSAKNCVCDTDGDDDCGSYAAQLTQLAIDCADLKTIKGDFKDGVVKKVSIKGKGDGEID
jgi:hypothetical protein